MNNIIDFLNSDAEKENGDVNSFDKVKLSSSYNALSNVLNHINEEGNGIIQLKNKPDLKKGQIWLCKQYYYDAIGNEIKGKNPYLVVIVSNVDKLANHHFVRIQPISPFTEFKANDDLLITDKSITGFDFILETWNEQPILISLLRDFVNVIDTELDQNCITEVGLSTFQKEFRKVEIRNTEYLRHSVNAALKLEELSEGNTIFMNINNSLIYPNSKDENSELGRSFNENLIVSAFSTSLFQAAKKGNLKEDNSYFFQETIEGIEIKIKIIKENESYILSIVNPKNMEVKDEKGELLKPTTPNIYDNLNGGLYFISIKEIENKIRIILK